VTDNRCRTAFCVSGGGRIARAAIEQAQSLNINPVLLAAEAGAAAELSDFCEAADVTFVRLPKDRLQLDRSLVLAIEEADPELICLTFDKLIPNEIVEAWSGRILNLHMGILPQTAGLYPLRRAIESGSFIAGATVHEVTSSVDSGPIVTSVQIPIEPGDTVDILGARIYPHAMRIMLEAIARYADRT
jgi:phosphoribosylglycinamide formyltransferase-1